MSWQYFPLVPGSRPTAEALNELRCAFIERNAVAGTWSPPPEYPPGNRIKASVINDLRERILGIIGYFFEVTYTSEQVFSVRPYTTLVGSPQMANIFEAAIGHAQTTWTHPISAGSRMLADDLNEMQAVLNVLRWARAPGTEYNPYEELIYRYTGTMDALTCAQGLQVLGSKPWGTSGFADGRAHMRVWQDSVSQYWMAEQFRFRRRSTVTVPTAVAGYESLTGRSACETLVVIKTQTCTGYEGRPVPVSVTLAGTELGPTSNMFSRIQLCSPFMDWYLYTVEWDPTLFQSAFRLDVNYAPGSSRVLSLATNLNTQIGLCGYVNGSIPYELFRLRACSAYLRYAFEKG
jgi:hypothetical protein